MSKVKGVCVFGVRSVFSLCTASDRFERVSARYERGGGGKQMRGGKFTLWPHFDLVGI